MHQPIGNADGGGFILRPLTLVLAEQRIVADILTRGVRLRQVFRQRHHIAQAEVKPLPGDRMQRLRGIAYQRQTVRNRTCRGGKGERIHVSRTGLRDTP